MRRRCAALVGLLLIGIALMITNNRAVMGEYTGTPFQNIFSVFALLVTAALTLVMLWQWLQ